MRRSSRGEMQAAGTARGRRRLTAGAVLVATAACLLTAGQAQAAIDIDGIEMSGASPDGRYAYFESNAILTADDPGRNYFQLYRYSDGNGLTSVDFGRQDLEGQKSFENGVVQVADDGRAIVSTAGKGSPEDTDLTADLYLLEGDSKTLLTGFDVPYETTPEATPTFVGSSEDLSTVYFVTAAPLVSEDEDADNDIYAYEDGDTALISGGEVPGSPSWDVYTVDTDMDSGDTRSQVVSDDGSTIVFMTGERLLANDRDDSHDAYMYDDGELTLVTPDADGTDGDPPETTGRMAIGTINSDDHRVLFASRWSYLPEDGDKRFDWYLWNRDHLELVTDVPQTELGPYRVNYDHAVFDVAGKVVFSSYSDLVPEDKNVAYDLYAYEGGDLSIAARLRNGDQLPHSPNPLGIRPDGSEVYGQTWSADDPADIDGYFDIYAMTPSGGTWRSATTDGTDMREQASYVKLSDDGTAVVYSTGAAMVPGDDDCQSADDEDNGCNDLYLDSGKGPQLITGAYGEQHDRGNWCNYIIGDYCRDVFQSVSADGRTVYFESTEQLVPDDTEHYTDVFMWRNGHTRLISTGKPTEAWPTANLDDTRPPRTFITIGAENAGRDPYFGFRSDEPLGDSFECSLDGEAFTACTSQKDYEGLAEGSHRFEVRATDDAGNVDESPAVDTFKVDLAPPNTWLTRYPEPDGQGGYQAAFWSDEDHPTYECKIDDGPYEGCSTPWTLPPLTTGTHVFSVRAVDPAGTQDTTPDSIAFRVQSGPPETTIDSPRDGQTLRSNAASMRFHADFTGSTFECKLDDGPWSGCADPRQLNQLSDGQHTFAVRARFNAATEADPALVRFAVDTTAPDTSITAGPSGDVSATTAQFEFSGNQSGSTFKCSFDGAQPTECGSPKVYSSLPDGTHTFEVAATNAGRTDSTPAKRTFVVTGVRPETSITSGPSGTLRTTSTNFTFTSEPRGAVFRCSLDGVSYGPCSSPHDVSSLRDGPHTFSVKSIWDGREDPTPATRDFVVDTSSPDTVITSGPSGGQPSRSGTFDFSSDQEGAVFACRTDSARWETCVTPHTLTDLSSGQHLFEVRASNLGRTDPSPASRYFSVDPVPPDTVITSGPDATIDSPKATFSFISDRAGSTFRCSLDGAEPVACRSPRTFDSLAEGDHELEVAAEDAEGRDQTPALWRFRVNSQPPPSPDGPPSGVLDTVAPLLTIQSQPPRLLRASSSWFGWTSDDPDAEIACALDGGAFFACGSPHPVTGLSDGDHVFSVRGIDGAGNQGAVSASFRVDTQAPRVEIETGPRAKTSRRRARFGISAEPGSVLMCRIDELRWTSCGTEFSRSGLRPGRHSLQVTAVDPAGNEGAAAPWVWRVRSRR